MAHPPSLNDPQHAASAPDGGRRVHLPHPRVGHRAAPSPARPRPPDLAAAAADAVVRFLRDSSVAVAERDESAAAAGAGAGAGAGGRAGEADVILAAPDDVMPWSTADVGRLDAESVALKAAAVSVATLDRIEMMAAKLEADISSAQRAQAELQAGAGAAAEAAVRAAQAAWVAARRAEEADKQAKISLIRIARYVEITVVLLVISMIIFIVAATSAH
jgi:hypothetical protein